MNHRNRVPTKCKVLNMSGACGHDPLRSVYLYDMRQIWATTFL